MRSPHSRHTVVQLAIVSSVVVLLLGVPLTHAAETTGLSGVTGDEQGEGIATKLTVTSVGYMRTEPDLATISAAYSATAETSAEAEGVVRQMLATVGEAMAERGHTVTVGYFSIYPRYDYRGDSGPIAVGFEARRQLEVAVTEIDRVGEAVQLLLDLGVNEINSINYGLQDESSARREAIRRAMAGAWEQAETVAQLEGQRIAGVLSISIDSSMQSYYGGPVAYEATANLTPSPATVHVTASVEFLLVAVD